MGDRSNIVVKQSDGAKVWLYGHWMGTGAIDVCGEVLSRKERWSDEAYLARMLFSAMVKHDIDSDSGFGISTQMQDNEYPIIVLDPKTQTACIEEHVWGSGGVPSAITEDIPFEQFAEACRFATSYEELAVSLGAKFSHI